MPQVQFDRINDEDVAMCISKGWYLAPNVTWLDRAERDLSNHSTVEVLEEQMNGFYRVFSILKYPVKLNEKYVCRITETDVNNQPFRIIRKYPSKWVEVGCISPQKSHHSLIFTECQMYQALLGTLESKRTMRNLSL